MSPIFRARSGRSPGACRHAATPPRRRITTPASLAASTTRRDSSTGPATGEAPLLPGGEEEVKILTPCVEIHQDSTKEVRGVIAARVEAHCLADALGSLRLVDVSMQADHRLVLLDDLAHSFAADRNYAR